MNQDQMKQAAAEAALQYVKDDAVLGIGTGSTVNYFIAALAKIKHRINATVASSEASANKLKALNIAVIDLNAAGTIEAYFDGADEFNAHHALVKGGGGALTREKIIASASKQFICMVDQSKQVDILGKHFPIPVEVIPMARSYVAREIVKLGGDPVYREKFISDNGNVILDVHNLKILDPLEWEHRLKNIAGVVENGIFAARKADIILLSSTSGVTKL